MSVPQVRRVLTAVSTAAVLAVCLFNPLRADRLKLFLVDGGDIAVTEYEVREDRVRYFSIERNEWEEIPKDLIDLERTQQVNRRAQQESEQRRAENRRERAAERRARTELHQVPIEDGVYHLRDEEIVTVHQSVLATRRSKRRTLLKVLAPVPVITEKQTLAVEGVSAELVTQGPKPIFYMRLERFSRFGIVRARLEPGKKQRVMQEIHSHPSTGDRVELQEEIEVFRQQLAPTVYKIWPMQDLPPGEYALIDYTPEESDLRVWDFSHQPGSDTVPKS